MHIQDERIRNLNDNETSDGDYVLYWMQATQRVRYNHALGYAVGKANALNLPVVVYFGLTDDFPEANVRHYRFMLEGLKETAAELEELGMQMIAVRTSPPDGAIELSKGASLAVVDRGYLKVQKSWRETAARGMDCPLIEVESNVVVPVEEASDKEEYAARTIRPKINDLLDKYLVDFDLATPDRDSLDLEVRGDSLDLDDPGGLASSLDVDRSVRPVDSYHGGYENARRRLDDFVEVKLDSYPEESNDPGKDYLSGLSPYLHFGQISPIEIALTVQEAGGPGVDDFLEELIVRRELSMNFVHYNEDYDDLWKSIPGWAEESLKEHAEDNREYLYSPEEFEDGKTHDPYWNAAQLEMNLTGKTHGYMRMYWVKKILQWTENPQSAYEIAIYLNNKYELDGRDSNGFTGVAWCFGKHDRAWKEREVLGKVRYMSAGGLERKFAIDDYVVRIEALRSEVEGG